MFELSNFRAMRIGLASPEKILEWSYGEVTKPETINYRTQKPEKDGLFCEKIFGPCKDYVCNCGKYKRQTNKGVICDRCGVLVTVSAVRRERMGHIKLATPCSHIWFFKINPSSIGQVLDISAKALEQVLYYQKFIVLEPGPTDFVKKQIINDDEYRKACEIYGSKSFKVGMGGEAIKYLLKEVNIEREIEELRRELENAKSQKSQKIIRRLEILEAFYNSGNRPEWMIFDYLPVLPPDLRPMVQLDGGRYATNDLNDLYRRLINRNNRLKRLIELNAPDLIVRNEKRMLQEAVDALIDNGKHGKEITGGSKNRPLKSIYGSLKGKQGRFRQNLLGKRVDYSGRAVIVIGPELKMYQCGLPKHMALELFKPFIMKRILDANQTYQIKKAKELIEEGDKQVWDYLDEIIKDHPILLNRAPTLHKLSIQAFEPVLVEGNAIKLHPLVCQGFNADFDGDQMAVHVPLSLEARTEARFLMLSTNNIVKPSDGKPIVTPQQDIVLGCYYLTVSPRLDLTEEQLEKERNKVNKLVEDEELRQNELKKLAPLNKNELNRYISEDEAIKAYQLKKISLQEPIWVRRTVEFNGEMRTGKVITTVGRILFNRAVPQDIDFVDRTKEENIFRYEIEEPVGKDKLGKIVSAVYKKHENTKTAIILDDIKTLGYKYSTLSGITMNLYDMDIPEQRESIIAETQKLVDVNELSYKRGFSTRSSKVDKNIELWNKATKQVSDAVRDNLYVLNPIKLIAVSKARTNPNQLNQVCGMRGITTSTSAEKIDIPIKSNYRVGLTPFEYFTSARGGRKGLADTALKTAEAGYLTRRLVDVAQNVVITEEDCCNGSETIKGMKVKAVVIDETPVISLANRIVGRVAVKDVLNPETNEVIAVKNEIITEDQANLIEKVGIEEVEIRTVFSCKAKTGICAKCYGKDMSQNRLVAVGEAVGIIAAQSVGEPGTQLTMKNFHTGGVATASDITTGLPRVEELFEARKPKRAAVISEVKGRVTIETVDKIQQVTIISPNNEKNVTYSLPYGSQLAVKVGDIVEPGTQLTKGSIYPNDILKTMGERAVQEYLINQILAVYSGQDVNINPKHLEIIISQMMRKVQIDTAGDTKFLPTTLVDLNTFEEENLKMLMQGKATATAKKRLLGITKASLYTESFLSAASFQETSSILTESSIKGKVDYLNGLKENAIIGKLIPAGTGISNYANIEISKPEQVMSGDNAEEITETEPENNSFIDEEIGDMFKTDEFDLGLDILNDDLDIEE